MGNGGSWDPSRLRLARGAPSWVPLLGLAALVTGARSIRGPHWARTAGLAIAVTGGVVFGFFRDPERELGDGIVLAAADGVVSGIEHEADGRVRILTFMRLHDVHVNRTPLPGVVRDLRHREGGYRPAYRKDSDVNERMEWTIDTDLGELRIAQIAGVVARRIVAYRRPGEHLERGQRIGMIRFGSRVDVTLPLGVACGVRVGQRVRAGVSRLDQP
jgi:phosphatidylserine decarboxylase